MAFTRKRVRAAAGLLGGLLAMGAWQGVVVAETVRAVVDATATVPGERVLATRGSYKFVEVPDTDEARAALAATGGELREDLTRIHLNRGVVETRSAEAMAAQQRLAVGPTRRLQLVQFPAPPNDDELAALEGAGYAIVHAVPENAFIVWRRASAPVARLSSLAGDNNLLGWAGDYRPEYALAPALDRAIAETPDGLVDVTLQLFNHPTEGGERSAAQAADDIMAMAAKVIEGPREVLGGHYLNLTVSLPASQVADLPQLDAVVWIEPYRTPRRFDESQGQAMAGNLNQAGTYPTTSGYLNWITAMGFPSTPASYPIVCIVDDGIDDGDATPTDRTLREGGSPGGATRLVFNLNKTTETSPAGPDGHGHINASIAVGLDTRVGSPAITAEGFNRGIGISPHGRVGNLKVFLNNGGAWWGGADSVLAQDQWNNSTGISSNSWGTDTGGAYDSDAQEYDGFTRDAHSGIAGHQPLFFVFAAGNAGPTVNTMGSPGTAKNVLTVGAVEGFIAEGTADGCGDTTANNFNDMGSFSSRGPCDDSRVKPDVVAPGVHITGTAPPSFNGTGVCGGSSSIYFPTGQTTYTWSTGTSHSTPAVAGFASLVGNFLQREYGFGALPASANAPTPALMKAYIVHGTRYLSGGTGTGGNLPSNNFGFGAPNGSLAFSTAAPRFFRNQQDVLGGPGQSVSFRGYVPNPAEPVRIVLAWTDAPGPLSGNAYVNNLDLLVGSAPITYKGNVFNGGTSVTGGSHDVCNNVESVFLPAGALSGSTQISVSALAVNGDGVPGNGDATDQDFALVAYNFVQAQKAGRVFWRRPASGSTGAATIDLFDSDLAALAAASVSVTTSNGDAELVDLVANPLGSGVFSGTISTNLGSPAIGSGSLDTACGATATILYLDGDPGPGGDPNATDTLTINCTGPAITSVKILDVTPQSARVTFNTNASALGRVTYGTGACNALATIIEGPVGTSHTFTLPGLAANTVYRFSVGAEGFESGLSTTDNNAGACYNFATPPAGRYFTELFSSSDNDLDNMTLTFTPNGTSDHYTVCRSAAVSFPTTPAGGTAITPGDDGNVLVSLTGGKTVPIYGVNYSNIQVNGNGFLTFGAVGVVDATETLAEHFSRVQVSMLYDDLDPSAGGTVSHRQLADRFVVTYQNVPEWNAANQNSFQAELFFDGVIRLTWLSIAAVDGLAGLSRGGGQPTDFAEMNLNATTPCGGFLSGDVNGDTRVDLADVTALNNYLAAVSTTIPPGDPDVDNNGLIEAADATLLIGHLVNQSPPALP